MSKNISTVKIGFTCGSFDVTHCGHYLMFEECRKQCDYLIVAIQTDPTIDRPEKHKPVQTIEERIIQVKACRHVDGIVIYDTEEDLYKLLTAIKIDTRFLGEDWKDKEYTGKDLPINVVFTTRNHHYSSSNLRKRICAAEGFIVE